MPPEKNMEQNKEKKAEKDLLPLPPAMGKAKSSASHLKVGNIEKPHNARPTTPNAPAKT